ncbi:MAG: GLPGLI family protein [Flavobacterium sp. BFFFF2]|nr:MAG: GLPGLI family protein [Flavobacterium sp. BFFFF2]
MKKWFLLLLPILGWAQADFQGMAVYESKTSISEFKKRFENNKEITPEMRTMMEERMKKTFEKTFILHFDKSTSTYKEDEKLDTPGQNGGGGFRFMTSMMGVGGTYYKNIKSKTYTVDREFMSKEFLIQDSLPKLQWKLEQETKEIGGYTCLKATAVRAASQSDFRNFRMRNRDKDKTTEEKKDAKNAATDGKTAADKKPEGEKKTNFMDEVEMPKKITITAWYSPEIPISQGPESYWGLPGLILEVSDGKTVVLCSKLVLNAKDKAVIKAPTNGKVVSQKEYDDIVVKKMEEWREMNPGGPGRGGSHMRF